jgi:tellurite resistance protein TerC
MWLWAAFIIFILFLLALDLGVFHRKAHVMTLKEALASSGAWISIALAFNVFVYLSYEHHWFRLDIPGHEPDRICGREIARPRQHPHDRNHL